MNSTTTAITHIAYNNFFASSLLAQPIFFFVSLVFPTYASFKAIKSVKTDDDKQWLMYWIIYGFIFLIELVFSVVLYYIPLYWELKICFFIWLQHPKFRGAILLYRNIVEPFLKKHEAFFDKSIQSGKASLGRATSKAAQSVLNSIAETKTKELVEGITSQETKKNE